MASLFDIQERYSEVLSIIELHINDYSEQAIHDTLDALGFEFEEKADAYARAIAAKKSANEALKKEIGRLTGRIEANTKQSALLAENLKNAMEATGRRKFKTALHDFGIRKNPPGVVIDEQEKIPACYMRAADPVPDRAAIREAIKAGREVPGARLEQSESLRIS